MNRRRYGGEWICNRIKLHLADLKYNGFEPDDELSAFELEPREFMPPHFDEYDNSERHDLSHNPD